MNLLDAVSYHHLVLASEGRSAATQRNYLFFQRLFTQYLEAAGIAPELAALSPANVRSAGDWYRARVNRNDPRGGERGVLGLITRLKTFARFLSGRRLSRPGTLARVRPPTVTKHMRELFTTDELQRMWAATRSTKYPLRDEALFLLLLDTGVRIGEASTLTLDRLQLDRGRIIVGAGGKSRRERIVPIGDSSEKDGGRTLRALRVYLDVRPDRGQSEGRVFLTREGAPLLSEGASRAIQRLGDTAGVNNPIAHRLRHTMATTYLTMNPGTATRWACAACWATFLTMCSQIMCTWPPARCPSEWPGPQSLKRW
jgi:site-specific recombinase XerD